MKDRQVSIKGQLLLLMGLWILFTGSAFAAVRSSVTFVLNELETGIVDISLKEYTLDENGREVLWKDKENIMPGDSISKIPKITNEAMNCWVRAKVKLSSSAQSADALSLEHIRGISKDWIKIGEYFYYTKVLKSKETVVLFEGLSIPENWSKEQEQSEIKVIVQVDAVQEKNFTPNFSKDTPWGGLSVQKCIHENEYDLNTFKVETKKSLTVQYEKEAKKIIAAPRDFFAQFGTLMPGDTQKGVVKIKNEGKNPITIFFKTEGVEESQLLEKIQLTITNRADVKEEGKVLYDGNLRSRELENYFSLGRYEPSYEGEFVFQLKLPEELDNTYSLEKRKVKWYFMAEETLSLPPATTRRENAATSYKNQTSSYQPSTSVYSNHSNSQGKTERQSNSYKNGGEDGSILQKIRPKTGDTSNLEFYITLAFLSLIGIIMTTKNIKRQNLKRKQRQ